MSRDTCGLFPFLFSATDRLRAIDVNHKKPNKQGQTKKKQTNKRCDNKDEMESAMK